MICPQRFARARFAHYTAHSEEQAKALRICRRYADAFPTLPRNHTTNLLLLGKVGTGKTHLACAIGHQVNATLQNRRQPPSAHNVIYTTVLDAVRTVRETYSDRNSSEAAAIKQYTSPRLLILDEVGVQSGSDHEKMMLTDIMDTRWANGLNTVIVSNLSRDELRDFLGLRAFDRMLDGDSMVVPFTWASYRGKANSTLAQPAREDEREPQSDTTSPEARKVAAQNVAQIREYLKGAKP